MGVLKVTKIELTVYEIWTLRYLSIIMENYLKWDNSVIFAVRELKFSMQEPILGGYVMAKNHSNRHNSFGVIESQILSLKFEQNIFLSLGNYFKLSPLSKGTFTTKIEEHLTSS